MSDDRKVVFETTFEAFESNLWGGHFPVSSEVAEQFKGRIFCRINGQIQIQCAILSAYERRFILVNRQLQKKLQLSRGSRVTLEILVDTTKYGMAMPETLEAVLMGDAEADAVFHRLTPGKQRNLIHIVAKVKSLNAQLPKALAIALHLKESEGQLDFKRLNEVMKYYNNLHVE